MYICMYVCVYLYNGLTSCSPHSQAAQALKQFADEEETFTYSETLMLEVDFETLIDDVESGVDEYMVFKDTISGQSEVVRVCHVCMRESRLGGCVHILLVISEQQIY